MTIKIQVVGQNVPKYATAGDAGADLVSAEDIRIPAHQRVLVKTGIKIAIPNGYVGLVHPRSGLALKHGITVLNAPGTIDAGYRGEVGVILLNTGSIDFEVSAGDRIAQLVIQKVEYAEFESVDELSETDRGSGGFGSTGVTNL
jgi:dUTP pyrophosphatase